MNQECIQTTSLKLYVNGFIWYEKCLSEMLNGIITNLNIFKTKMCLPARYQVVAKHSTNDRFIFCFNRICCNFSS